MENRNVKVSNSGQIGRDVNNPKLRSRCLIFGVRGSGPGALGYGGIAQLGEHLLCKQGVIGSSPIISTKWLELKYGLIAQQVRASA